MRQRNNGPKINSSRYNAQKPGKPQNRVTTRPQDNKNKNNNETEEKEQKKESWAKRLTNKYPKLVLLTKTAVVVGTAVACVSYTDKKNYFEPKMTYHETNQAEAFYRFTEKDTVDVLVLGNSIVGAGINCHFLNSEIGCNSFTHFTSCSGMKDQYWTLRGILKRTKPKVLVLETFGIGDLLLNTKPTLKTALSFKQRTDTLEKIKSMPEFFTLEEYWGAWSCTIRNHDFIFRDTTQINANKAGLINKMKPNSIYLGDSNYNQSGISDSLDAVYDKEGPMVDGQNMRLQPTDWEYVGKIKNLCDEHGIELVFLTLPMYYKHFVNYDCWREKLDSIIRPTNSAWLDLQANYDTLHYGENSFENIRQHNLHMVYNGAVYATHQLSEFLRDSLKLDLPKRDTTKRWNDMFYGTEGYLYNYLPRETDTVNISLGNDLQFGKINLNNAFLNKAAKNNYLYLKIEKGSVPKDQKTVYAIVKGTYKGKELLTKIEMTRAEYMGPTRYDIFQIGLIKEFEPKQVTDITL